MQTEILRTESQHAEQALGESQERYRRLLAATTDYIYTVHVAEGRSVETSHGPGCAAVTGYSSSEFTADPYLWYRVIHEEDREAVVEQARRILAGEVPPPLEHRLVNKDGSVRWIRNTPIPHRDADGHLIAYDGLITDITTRKHAELLLAAEYTITRDLTTVDHPSEAMPQVIEHLCRNLFWHYAAYWEREGNVLRRARSFWRSLTSDASWESMMRGKTLAAGMGLPGRVLASGEAIWIPDLSRDPELAREAPPLGNGPGCACAFPVRTDETCHGVIQLHCREIRPVDERMLEVLAALGVHIGQFVDRKQAAARLERAYAQLTRRGQILKRMVRELHSSQKQLRETQEHLIQAAKLECVGTLAAGVAHEVKNPLQTILFGLHFLTHKFATPDPDTAQTLKEMHEAVNRANVIIRELLRLSAVSHFDRQPGDLNELIEHSIRLVDKELMAAHVNVERHLDVNLPRVAFDANKMEQVFINVLLNAIQAMPKGGTITLTTHTVVMNGDNAASGPLFARFHPHDLLLVSEIEDSGAGISETDLPRVFDPFFTTKPVGVGTGLGLSISRKIIDLHGGAIGISNRARGGARVTVILKA